MCQRLLVPTSNLYPSPHLDATQLALVETLCIGAHAVRRSKLTKADIVVIVGTGPIGLATAQLAAAEGASVLLTDVNDQRLRFAAETVRPLAAELAGDGLKERLLAAANVSSFCI